MLASWRGHLNTVKVLLRAGAKTDAQDQVCKYSKATNPVGEREEKDK